MKDILVSLVIPAYNVENLIGYTLDSVINQTLKRFECIVVDDFSTDNTKQIVLDYVKRDKRFKLLSHRANAGLSAARNTGLRFSKGQFVAFLDSDDLLMPESLEERAQTLDRYSNDKSVIGTYCASLTIPMDATRPPAKKPVKLKVVDFITAAGSCPFNANQPMFKTKEFKTFGGFDHSLKQAEDYDMWVRVLRAGYSFKPTDSALVTYRKTEGSMIRNNPLLHLDTSYNKFISCYQDFPVDKWNRKQAINLSKGLNNYIAELNIANRVLEFVGLGLAKGENKYDLVSRLHSYLPSYFEIIETHRPFELGIVRGLSRYSGKNININSDENLGLKKSVKELYDLFKERVAKYKLIGKLNSEAEDGIDIVSRIGCQKTFDLIFIPHKDYHVHAISLLKPYLIKKNISFIILDISMHYRDEGVQAACKRYNLPIVGYSNFLLGDFEPKAIVCFNDWDPIVRSIIKSANHSNINTIGIVEGIQDYLDADTKQERLAYRTVKHLALPGEHDRKYFKNSEQNIFVGGVPRIFDLYKSKANTSNFVGNRTVLINSNFSYGVLEECRDDWLVSAVNTCERLGFDVVVSRHPADKGQLFKELTTNDNFYNALEQCDVLISRFASGILEALAIGKLPIYFNPHGEKADKFQDPKGAYPLAKNESDLEEILLSLDYYYKKCKGNFSKFLESHAGLLSEDPSSVIVDKFCSIIGERSEISYDKFYRNLKLIDTKSGCFNNISALKDVVFSSEHDETMGVDVNFDKIFRLIRERKYEKVVRLLNKKLEAQSDNPAYILCRELAEKLRGR